MRYTSQQLTELVGRIVLRLYLKHNTSRRVEGKEKRLFKKVSTVKASSNMTDFSLKDVVFQWLTTNDIQLNNIDAEDPEVCNVFLPRPCWGSTQ